MNWKENDEKMGEQYEQNKQNELRRTYWEEPFAKGFRMFYLYKVI